MALEQRRFSLEDLRRRLANRRSRTLGRVPPNTSESAVLALLYEEDDETHVVLTRRSPLMRQHAHEMAFPGGRRDPSDRDLWATAVRESVEEVGLDPPSIELLGTLDSFVTGGSGVLVKPFVAAVLRRPSLTVASPDEVEAIRHVRVSELLRDDVWREEIWPDRRRADGRAIIFFEIAGDTIWGATGSMLKQLLTVGLGIDE